MTGVISSQQQQPQCIEIGDSNITSAHRMPMQLACYEHGMVHISCQCGSNAPTIIMTRYST